MDYIMPKGTMLGWMCLTRRWIKFWRINKMKKIIIFGKGERGKILSKCFDEKSAEILAFIDNNITECCVNGIQVQPVEFVKSNDFDYIFISSSDYEKQMTKQILNMGIESEKIISPKIYFSQVPLLFDLLNEKGMSYIWYMKQSYEIDHVTKTADSIWSFMVNRFANLYLKECAEKDATEFITHEFINNGPGKTKIFVNLWEYFNYVLKCINHIQGGLYLEFGVYKGGSINYIAERIGDNLIYGFDSFEGLPSDWIPEYPKGTFSQEGNIPEVKENVRLIKGWFDKTLPTFVEKHKHEKCALINIDCDLYESTKIVLNSLKDNIVQGTIIMFDEYCGQIGWREDEYKAWQEFTEEQGIKYKYLACSHINSSGMGYQLTVKVAVEVMEIHMK